MSRRLLLLASLLAGAQMLAATTAFVDVVPGKTAAMVAAAIGACQLALVTYTHGLQSPTPIPDAALAGLPEVLRRQIADVLGDSNVTPGSGVAVDPRRPAPEIEA